MLGGGDQLRCFPGSVDDALVEHFFGHDMSGKLTVEKFRQFHRKLRLEILKLEVCTYVCTCTCMLVLYTDDVNIELIVSCTNLREFFVIT